MKYQFCIRFRDIDPNSAASKAVTDCNEIFSKSDYRDHTIVVGNNSKKSRYYLHLFRALMRFFFLVKPRSIIGVQYPLLSVNEVFKYFIAAVKLRKGKFFCIIHDLESLRMGGSEQRLITAEVHRLNCYDYIVTHNQIMTNWLRNSGVVKPMIDLELFDYLADEVSLNKTNETVNTIVFAGNLAKSTFIYKLFEMQNCRFNLYGPGFDGTKIVEGAHVAWKGEYDPVGIVGQLEGSYGLIWDGDTIDQCDAVLGNYLKYNNPHKFSLYLAAGLPVIAPEDAAIGEFIKKHKIGVLIKSLRDIGKLDVLPEDYEIMKRNVAAIRQKVINGCYFESALLTIEKKLCEN